MSLSEPIVASLAKEFSVQPDQVALALELLGQGLRPPYIAQFRRAEVGQLTEGSLRRLDRRRRSFEELEGRRATILRSIEKELAEQGSEDPKGWRKEVEDCVDRGELEDYLLPHRRPEPEVQLALDRGLGGLADLLVESAPKESPAAAAEGPAEGDPSAENPEAGEAAEADSQAPAAGAGSEEAQTPAAEESAPAAAEPAPAAASATLGGKVDLTPELARVCAPFVNPDRDVHTESQALEGAMRILSDRIGRNPSARRLLRRTVRKHGRVSVRSLVDDKKLGRSRSLLKVNEGLRQIQGHKLLNLRQAQIQRHIITHIEFDKSAALPRILAAICKRPKPEFKGILTSVTEQAIDQRILPMIEEDLRAELRERAEDEALRLINQHLRQVLMAPLAGPRPAVGLDVNAKGDWTLVTVDADGKPSSPEVRIETKGKRPGDLANELGAAIRDSGSRSLVVGHGKGARKSAALLREILHLIQADPCVFLVNEAGLSSYANSQQARSELADYSVPGRMAISLARRHQDPLRELIKVEARHLGLGGEQSVISKSGLRRILHETLESCVAQVGCDLNRAPLSLLRYIPGLDFDLARKLVERRTERPFSSRQELLDEGLLDPVAWKNAIGFLRVENSEQPLDRTALHPEQYELVSRILAHYGRSLDEVLGSRDGTRGMKRADLDVDEGTWRDVVRELAYPGRDPRHSVFPPYLLAPDTDPDTIEKEQVVEGIVSNVASFGTFIDLGIAKEGMIHISEMSNRYVRDARGLFSIGQIVRARVTNASGPRIELSLKNVPEPKRRTPERRKPRRKPEDKAQTSWPEYQPVRRAAQSRRDGLVVGEGPGKGKGGRRGGGGKGGGRGGPGGGHRGGPGRGRGRDRKDDSFDAAAVREAQKAPTAFNPFATFFKDKAVGKDAPPADSGGS